MKRRKEPPFIKLYLEDLSRLTGLTGTQRLVLDGLMKYAQYGNEIVISPKIKSMIIQDIGCTNGSFKNALGVLVHKEIIQKGEKRSIYIINPKLAFKGKSGDRAKLIISYNGSERENLEFEVENGEETENSK